MKLFEPGIIGKLSIKNRIVMAPMGVGGLCEPDGRLSQRAIDYYVARAKGGTGLIISCVSRVSRQIEHFPNVPLVFHPMIDNFIYVSRLSELADAVHDYGAKMAVQLTAGFGRVLPPVYLKKTEAVAPSKMPCFWNPNISTRELTVKEIETLVEAFKFGAEIMRTAGIDAVELHAHEGYLFDQFQTALWNQRTDKYGGDLEGRLTFALEVIDAIKRGAGPDFPIIYRFGLTQYLDGGREIEEGLRISRVLATKVDAFHIDAGCYDNWYWPHPPTYLPAGCMVDLAEMVKKEVQVPVVAVGKLGNPDLAEEVLQQGKADFIALGRALLADPDWPNKVKERRVEDICPCIGDHDGCMGRVMKRHYVSCTVNAMTGMEREFSLNLAKKRKFVLVVGGGPGGMEAARVASLRGHKVVLWEKNNSLGGNLIPASVPEFKQEYRDLIQYFSAQMKKLGVTIQLGREATPVLIMEMKPEAIIIATGARPIVPEIEGIERRNVLTASDLLLSKKEVRGPIAVVGGGLLGCETSLYLAQRGKKVTIVEMLDTLASGTYEANRMLLLKMLLDAKVKCLTGAKVFEVREEGVNISHQEGERDFLEANTVVLAVGLKSNDEIWKMLGSEGPEIHAIGDCVRPRRVINAIWEGFRTARLI